MVWNTPLTHYSFIRASLGTYANIPFFPDSNIRMKIPSLSAKSNLDQTEAEVTLNIKHGGGVVLGGGGGGASPWQDPFV